jgi:hypothetical protein
MATSKAPKGKGKQTTKRENPVIRSILPITNAEVNLLILSPDNTDTKTVKALPPRAITTPATLTEEPGTLPEKPKRKDNPSKMELRKIAARKKHFISAMVKTMGIASKASKLSKIPLRTHYFWLQSDEVYKDEVQNVRELAVDFYEEALHDLVQQRNVAAVIFALKTQGKKRGYIETVHNMNQAMDDNNVHIYIPDNGRDGFEEAKIVNE